MCRECNRQSQLKYYIPQCLTFDDYILAKCKAAAINIQYLKSLREHLSLDTAKQLASALVLSHLDYGNGVLVDLPDSSILCVQRSQNWAAKVVLGQDISASSKDALLHSTGCQ